LITREFEPTSIKDREQRREQKALCTGLGVSHIQRVLHPLFTWIYRVIRMTTFVFLFFNPVKTHSVRNN
jgi:hypothetical protein